MTAAADVPRRIEYLPLHELQPAVENPKGHDAAALRASIDRFGLVEVAAVIDERTERVISGHGRLDDLRAAWEAGIDPPDGVLVDDDGWLVPVLRGWASLDDAEAEAALIAVNETTIAGGWRQHELAPMLQRLADSRRGLTGTGFDRAGLADLLRRVEQQRPKAEGEKPDGPAPESLIYDVEQIVAAALAHYREAGFPIPQVPLYDAMQQLNRLRGTPDDGLMQTIVGLPIADRYQPHRYSCQVESKPTPLNMFDDDARMVQAMTALLVDSQVPISDGNLRSILRRWRGAQLAAQFRPGFALSMYRRFCPEGGTLLDTSTGYGGRMLGFFASDCSTYIGVDPHPITSDGNRRMAADLCPPDKVVELHELPAEDVPHELVAGRADFAFTSPPYFSKEHYHDDDLQSWRRYSTGEAWRDGFLQPMLALQYAALRPGAFAAVNIAPVKVRGKLYPLLDWTIECGLAVGFEHERTERYVLSRVPGKGEDKGDDFEPVAIFHKPAAA